MSEEMIESTESTEPTEIVESNVEESSVSTDKLADSLANDLFPHREEQESTDKNEELTLEAETEEKPKVEEKPVREPPQSWKKEMHDKYVALPDEVKDYIELREKQMSEGIDRHNQDTKLGMAMRDAITPYKAEIARFNMDEATAVKSLLNAQYKLTNGSPEQRQAAYRELGRNLGFETQEDEQHIDPVVKQLQSELYNIKNSLNANQQREQEVIRTKTARDVETFAADAKHPYFDEVTDDIVQMISAGHNLEVAYEKAVWANPVTREKEIARLKTEQETSLREKSQKEADAAKKLKGINVTSRDTRKPPTGMKGTMSNLDSVLKESMREIKSRTH